MEGCEHIVKDRARSSGWCFKIMEGVESTKRTRNSEQLSDFGAERPSTGHWEPRRTWLCCWLRCFRRNVWLQSQRFPKYCKWLIQIDQFQTTDFVFLCLPSEWSNGRCGFLWWLKTWTQILEELMQNRASAHTREAFLVSDNCRLCHVLSIHIHV